MLTDRYEIGALIAAGGMADVHLARDLRLDRDVAVKAFRVDAGDSRRFEAETKILSSLAHPNLIAVFDAGEEDGTPFLVLQRIVGPTLAARLREGALREDELRRVGSDVAAALEYVHRQRIVHRDVKPSNILIDEHGNALLADFGVAMLVDATRLTLDAAMIGTAAYLAPEQATGGEVTAAADVYSLGLVLLEALTGHPAFSGTMQELVTARVTRELDIPSDLAPPWSSLLTAMTRRDPAVRPSAAQVLRHLGGASDPGESQVAEAASIAVVAGGFAPSAVEPGADATTVAASTRSTSTAAPRGRRPLAVAGGIVLAVVVIGVLLNAASGDDPPAVPSTTTTVAAPVATTVPPVVAEVTTVDAQAARCAEIEQQKRDLEREKERVEEAYRDDKETRNRLKDELEAEKKAIDQAKKEADC